MLWTHFMSLPKQYWGLQYTAKNLTATPHYWRTPPAVCCFRCRSWSRVVSTSSGSWLRTSMASATRCCLQRPRLETSSVSPDEHTDRPTPGNIHTYSHREGHITCQGVHSGSVVKPTAADSKNDTSCSVWSVGVVFVCFHRRGARRS